MAAGTSIFTLMGEIFIDNDKANKSISKTESLAGKMGRTLGKGIKTAGKWGLALGAAATTAGAGLLATANSAAKAADEIDKGSDRMGVSTQAYQEMEYWASQNGVAQEQMEKAVGRLNQRMGMAASGNEKYADALEAVGVNMEDVTNGSITTEDAFATSLQTLSNVTNENEKAALATELFGTKLARDLLPALNDGSLSFEEAKQKAQEMGLVMSEDAIDAGVKFQDSMDNVKRSLGRVKDNIGVQLLPMFQSMLDWVMDHMPEIQEIIKKVFGKVEEFVNVATDVFKEHFWPALKNIYNWLDENWPTIETIIKGVFEGVKWAWNNILSPVLGFLWDLLEDIVFWVEDNWPEIEETFKTVFEGIVTAVQTAIDIFTGLRDRIKEALGYLKDWNSTNIQEGNFSEGGGDGSGGGGTGGRGTPHQNGLDYVPYDNYPALLHEGEEVVSSADKQSISNQIQELASAIGQNTNNQNPINLTITLDGKVLARKLYDPFRNEEKDRGKPLVQGI